jgi:adenylate cyclase
MTPSRRSMREMSHAFLFADLCGFTAYTHRHGDELATRLALAFHERAGELAAEESCDVVKSIGDAVMVRADECRAAIRLAWRILALSELEDYPPIRVGVDIGPAVEHRGDWYGSTVNIASRMTDAASPGELVLTDRARAAIAGAPHVELRARGVCELKGLPQMRIHAAVIT